MERNGVVTITIDDSILRVCKQTTNGDGESQPNIKGGFKPELCELRKCSFLLFILSKDNTAILLLTLGPKAKHSPINVSCQKCKNRKKRENFKTGKYKNTFLYFTRIQNKYTSLLNQSVCKHCPS